LTVNHSRRVGRSRDGSIRVTGYRCRDGRWPRKTLCPCKLYRSTTNTRCCTPREVRNPYLGKTATNDMLAKRV